MRELTTRLPVVNALRNYRQHDFDIRLLELCEATPRGGDRDTHAPTQAREDLSTVLALMAKGNAAAIVQDAGGATNGVAIFGKVFKAYGQPGCDGVAHLLQLKELSFSEAGDANRTHQKIHRDLQRLPQHDWIRDPHRDPTDISPRRAPHARHQRRRWHHAGSTRTRRIHATAPEHHIAET